MPALSCLCGGSLSQGWEPLKKLPQQAWQKRAAKPSCVLQAVQEAFFRELELDAIGFAGAVIVRRILGIAHVVDFESINDPAVRQVCCSRQACVSRLRQRPEAVPTWLWPCLTWQPGCAWTPQLCAQGKV